MYDILVYLEYFGFGIPERSLSDLLNQTWVSFSFSVTNRIPHLAHKGIFPDSNLIIRFFTLHEGQGIMLEIESVMIFYQPYSSL